MCVLNLKLSNNAFEIQRKLSLSFLNLFSALAGSIFGFMEIFALLLGLIESFLNKVVQRIRRKIFPRRLRKNKSKIDEDFQVKEDEVRNRAQNTSNEFEIDNR